MFNRHVNKIEFNNIGGGPNRQLEFISEPLENSTFFPKTLLLEDIDKAVKEWVNSLEITSDDGSLFPTMSLYSNQRFSEYMQSWKYTDSNNNLLLNFKTITRDNNPYFGEIQGKNYNIPGEIFFHMKSQVVLDDNGSESLMKLKMKQPTSVDLTYKMSLFTTNIKHINTFNLLINRMFNSRQVYINPNGYYIPMVLDGVNDESQYNIDDRQFYSQTYDIKVRAYIITEDDFKVERVPLKYKDALSSGNNNTDIEIEEVEGENKAIITVTLKTSIANQTKFTIDTDFEVVNIDKINLFNNVKFIVNDSPVSDITKVKLKNGDEIKITYKKKNANNTAALKIYGNI